MKHKHFPDCECVDFIERGGALVLAAYPGDEVMGCAGAIMGHTGRGDRVTVVITSDAADAVTASEDGSCMITGSREASVSAAAVLDSGAPMYWGLSGKKGLYGERLIRKILDILAEERPNIVYAPSPMEMNNGRVAVAMAAAQAVQRHNADTVLASYEVSTPLTPNRLLNITDLRGKKLAALQCLKAQTERQDYEQSILALNVFRARALPAEVRMAEAYFVITQKALRDNPLSLCTSYRRRLGFDIETRDCNKPLVSIIIRSMGRKHLMDALDSLALQTYDNIEAVVVNAIGSGHPDVGEWCGRFPLRFIDSHTHLNRSRAANVGLNHARGKYLGFLDDDDLLYADHVESLVAVLERNEKARVAYAGVKIIEYSGGAVSGTSELSWPFNLPRLSAQNYIPIHAVLFERYLLELGCRFDGNLEYYEDWDFWLQLAQHTPFIHVDQLSACYRNFGHSGLTNDSSGERVAKARAAFFGKWGRIWSGAELSDVLQSLQDGFAMKALQSQAQQAQQKVLELESLIADKTKRVAVEVARSEKLLRANADLQESNIQLGQSNQQLQLSNQKLEQSNTQLGQSNQQLQRYNEQLNKSVATASQQLHDSHNKSQVHNRQILTLKRRLETLQKELAQIRASRLWRLTRPYVHARLWLRSRLKGNAGHTAKPTANAKQIQAPAPKPIKPTSNAVDIIIPVYRGRDETLRCIQSVLDNLPRIEHEVIVINDASPEPELINALEDLVRSERITLIHNEKNQGFVGTANTGLALHQDRDVLLLNSDTEVANNWLDRLRHCAYADERIATVTPFSNNATICSYPQFCKVNELPAGWTLKALDALFREVNAGIAVDIPTGVGFSMYMRRDCLNEIGIFDAARFGKGYGEENDYCMRAARAKWHNVLCCDTFVYHAGGVSFADSKNSREAQAIEILRAVHPSYLPQVHKHIAEDPLRLPRFSTDLARLRTGGRPVILFVNPIIGGGTDKHVQELVEFFSEEIESLILRPTDKGYMELTWMRRKEPLRLLFHLDKDYLLLLEVLRVIGNNLQRIHFHHVMGLNPVIWRLPGDLKISYYLTIHDYYMACPQISMTTLQHRYCGEPDEEGCNQCLWLRPAPDNVSIQDWRENNRKLIESAERVFAPSVDTAARIASYFPRANLIVAPHPDLENGDDLPEPIVQPIAAHGPLKILVLGALSPVKGADTLESCAIDAKSRELLLDFHLLGYAYRDLISAPMSQLQLHGSYNDTDVLDLIGQLEPHLAWFPALWPETYSYTLSACLKAGIPIVAPDLGAFPERLYTRNWSWVKPWQMNPIQWNDFFVCIREENFITGNAPEPPQVGPANTCFSYRRDYLNGIESDQPEAQVDWSLVRSMLRKCAYPR